MLSAPTASPLPTAGVVLPAQKGGWGAGGVGARHGWLQHSPWHWWSQWVLGLLWEEEELGALSGLGEEVLAGEGQGVQTGDQSHQLPRH